MNIVRKVVMRGHVCRVSWALVWNLKRRGRQQAISFFTRKEAEAARQAIVERCESLRFDACWLPRTAVLIMLHAICEGRDGIEFIPSEQVTAGDEGEYLPTHGRAH